MIAKCVICGKEFERTTSRRTCSDACMNLLKSRSGAGKIEDRSFTKLPRKTENADNVITAARLRSGMTQQQFADAMGVSTRVIHRWEANTVTPSIKQLKQISEVLGVDYITIVGDIVREKGEE